MKNLIVIILIQIIGLVSLIAKDQKIQIGIQKGEKWWAGIITDSHLMPFTRGDDYSFNSFANTAGNQVQPLLISNFGRYIWSEDPFLFTFRNDTIYLSSQFSSLQIGVHGKTLREVYQFVSQKFFPPSGRIPNPVLFTKPQFNTWIEFAYNQNEKDILDYAQKVIENGFQPGVLMIDEGWADTYGHWDFSKARFDNPKEMVQKLHEHGFKVMLWICPYITSNGPFYAQLYLDNFLNKNTVWILNKNNHEFPAIMRWWNGFSAVVDLTNPVGEEWFREQLDYLLEAYQVDGFKFDGGDAEHYSHKRFLTPAQSFEDTLPNTHSELFARLGLNYPLNEYRACWKMGGQPLAQRLRDKRHNWEDLRKLIPGIINQGLMGYPFTCPDMIGGGEYLSFLNLDEVDQELIIRSTQCQALMPMMQFSVAPWRVLSKENLAICRDMANLHVRMAQKILSLAKKSGKTGEPIIRSLEYQYPNQGFAEICDQFLLGDSILVAPMLEKGSRQRKIIFPNGVWKGDDGSTVEGPSDVVVDVPIERLPWYQRIR